jgi:glucose-6-phosphate isomerase
VITARWGTSEHAVATALKEAVAIDVVGRIRRRDASLWSADHAVQRAIANRLGWLEAPSWAEQRLEELRSFTAETGRFSWDVLLGMGGSSLAPEVLARTYGADRLIVLDSTDPSELAVAERRIDPADSLFFVASKSGETIETRSHAAYFGERASDPSRFVAITDPGSPLETLSHELGYPHVFLNPSDIGGRYSALTYFGLVPAAAIGIDPEPLLRRAHEASDADALELGVAFGELALAGRDKVTFVASPGFASFGAWAEQLLAESTGKNGKGIIPIDGEPLGSPDVYGSDRVFVAVGGDANLDALSDAGHPVVVIPASEPADLGGLFFTFELATAVAGWRMGVDPFDEPNVSESKQNTARLIEAYEREGTLPPLTPDAEQDGVQIFGVAGASSVADGLRRFLGTARPGDYVALQAFVPREDATERRLRDARTVIRDRLRVSTTVGFGPRFLHSTGQLHKGGPATGLYLQVTTEHPEDVPIPGKRYTFGVLQAAQAAGDFASLARHGRRAVRVHLSEGVDRGLATLVDLIGNALTS